MDLEIDLSRGAWKYTQFQPRRLPGFRPRGAKTLSEDTDADRNRARGFLLASTVHRDGATEMQLPEALRDAVQREAGAGRFDAIESAGRALSEPSISELPFESFPVSAQLLFCNELGADAAQKLIAKGLSPRRGFRFHDALRSHLLHVLDRRKARSAPENDGG